MMCLHINLPVYYFGRIKIACIGASGFPNAVTNLARICARTFADILNGNSNVVVAVVIGPIIADCIDCYRWSTGSGCRTRHGVNTTRQPATSRSSTIHPSCVHADKQHSQAPSIPADSGAGDRHAAFIELVPNIYVHMMRRCAREPETRHIASTVARGRVRQSNDTHTCDRLLHQSWMSKTSMDIVILYV